MAELIKEFSGHSGSQIFLMKDNKLFIRKVNNVARNYERLDFLYKEGYNVPMIYTMNDNTLDMEYIHGLDMKNYLKSSDVSKLLTFILQTLLSFSANSKIKNYTEVYYEKLKWLDSCDDVPFTKEELISKLPVSLPQTIYHGDFTLENIIHNEKKFYMIDAMTSEYDSYIFDIAKLRQDLECKWFLRNDKVKMDVKLKNLQDEILKFYPIANNNALVILMLLRVYPYSKDEVNKQFIMKEIRRLWK
jgi:tRNA A-37 threonylcarbamoyl transferase component Bud32